MPFSHFTERAAIKLLATDSRRADLSPYDLSRTHVALGRYLAYELLETLPLSPCPIQHPQGVRSGFCVAHEEDLLLLSLLRAGVYLTEGVREVLRRAAVSYVHAHRERGMDEAEFAALPPLAGRTVVLCDAVVNTGATLVPVLRQVEDAARIVVLSLVAPEDTARRLAADWPAVEFLYARLSTNQYTGVGATDTGNRLFGTLPGAGPKEPR